MRNVRIAYVAIATATMAMMPRYGTPATVPYPILLKVSGSMEALTWLPPAQAPSMPRMM